MISGVPIIIYVLSLIFKQETFAIVRFMGVLFGLGVALIAGAGITEEALITASFVGIALILLSTFFYALNVVYISGFICPKLIPHAGCCMDDDFWVAANLPHILIGHDVSLISSTAQNPAFLSFLLLHCFCFGSGLLSFLLHHLKLRTRTLLSMGLSDGCVRYIRWGDRIR